MKYLKMIKGTNLYLIKKQGLNRKFKCQKMVSLIQ